MATLAFVATTTVVAACDDAASPTPTAQLSRIDHSDASLLTHDFVAINFPTGLTNDGLQWYVSTAHQTYTIDPTTLMITGILPSSPNPRDLVWMWPGSLAYSLESHDVEIRSTVTGAVTELIPIPWRGGGIARWRDTLYVGDQDHDSVLAIYYSTMFPTPAPHPVVRRFAVPMRPEGLVIDSNPTPIATMWGISQSDSYLYHFDLLGNLIEKCDTPYEPGPFGLGGLSIQRDSFLIAHPTGGDPLAGTTIHRIAREELVCSAALNDTIDIIPGRFPNRINRNAGSRIEVAALTTPSRDATTLILATVRFGRTGTEALPLSSALLDVDGDGDIDVVYEFRQRDAGFVCGDVIGRLRANTTVGAPFNGIDQVVITPGCRP